MFPVFTSREASFQIVFFQNMLARNRKIKHRTTHYVRNGIIGKTEKANRTNKRTKKRNRMLSIPNVLSNSTLRDGQHPLPFFLICPNSFFNCSYFALTYVMLFLFVFVPVSGPRILEKLMLKAGFSGNENMKNERKKEQKTLRA